MLRKRRPLQAPRMSYNFFARLMIGCLPMSSDSPFLGLVGLGWAAVSLPSHSSTLSLDFRSECCAHENLASSLTHDGRIKAPN